MACLTNCTICGATTCNDHLCIECRAMVTEYALKGIPLDREKIKEEVEKNRIKVFENREPVY